MAGAAALQRACASVASPVLLSPMPCKAPLQSATRLSRVPFDDRFCWPTFTPQDAGQRLSLRPTLSSRCGAQWRLPAVDDPLHPVEAALGPG